MEKNRTLRIAVLGAESTGKTELCKQLAKYYNTIWVPEYAREYFNHSDIYNYTLSDLEVIAQKQLENENQMVINANSFLFCDTSLITIKIWAQLEFNYTPDLVTKLLQTSYYHHYLLCNNDVNWVVDSQRQNKFSRELIFEMNRQEIELAGGHYTIICGTEQKRLNLAIAALTQTFKGQNL